MNKRMVSFIHFHNSTSQTLDVILHGGSVGIDSPFMQKVFQVSKDKGNSVIMFNFPYFERGEDHSSGPKLKEELSTLKRMLRIAGASEFTRIRLIGKSLGGIVASFYLDSLDFEEKKRYEVIILGYVTGDVKLEGFGGKITIIQGEKDKFGDIDVVKKDLQDAVSRNIAYYQIQNADHSFRDSVTKEPIYEEEVIRILGMV